MAVVKNNRERSNSRDRYKRESDGTRIVTGTSGFNMEIENRSTLRLQNVHTFFKQFMILTVIAGARYGGLRSKITLVEHGSVSAGRQHAAVQCMAACCSVKTNPCLR